MTALILGVDGKFLAPVLSVLGIISGWIAGKTIKSVI